MPGFLRLSWVVAVLCLASSCSSGGSADDGQPTPSDDAEWESLSTEIRENAESRRAALEPYGEFPLLLEALLFEADPVGLNFETNTDEYRPEAQTIALRLPSATSSDDVLVIAHEEFVRWFGADIAGPANRYEGIAEATWELWESNDWINE